MTILSLIVALIFLIAGLLTMSSNLLAGTLQLLASACWLATPLAFRKQRSRNR